MIIDFKEVAKNLLIGKKAERNKALQESDKYMLQDYPITEENLIIVKNYRKELRDYFQTFVVVDWIFTLENQELPPLPNFPILIEVVIPIPPANLIYDISLTSNILSL